VTALPVCTSPKVDTHGDSIAIHESVTRILENDVSVYNVDSQLLRELRPDVIVTQIQCDVCAVSLRDVEASIAQWIGVSTPRLVAFIPSTIGSICDDISAVGRASYPDGSMLV